MNVFMLISIIICSSLQTVCNKIFSKKQKNGNLIFTVLEAFFVLIFFAFTVRAVPDKPDFLIFSVGFGISYGLATVASILAIRYGSIAQTSLVSSFSLLVPTFYGIFFLHDDFSIYLIVGILLLCVSLFLVNIGGSKNESHKKLSGKWIFFALILFFFNGMCSVFQKAEQIYCDGDTYSGIFMTVSLSLVVVVFSVPAIIKDGVKSSVNIIKGTWYIALAVGVLNGLVNLLVIKLNMLMSASLMFPLISAGVLVLNFAVSAFFKERYSGKQIIGFAAGIAAVVLMSI